LDDDEEAECDRWDLFEGLGAGGGLGVEGMGGFDGAENDDAVAEEWCFLFLDEEEVMLTTSGDVVARGGGGEGTVPSSMEREVEEGLEVAGGEGGGGTMVHSKWLGFEEVDERRPREDPGWRRLRVDG